MREIVDARGQRWRVWVTTPSRAEGLGGFGGGWLTFDDGTERRRLAPVPEKGRGSLTFGWRCCCGRRVAVWSDHRVSGARSPPWRAARGRTAPARPPALSL